MATLTTEKSDRRPARTTRGSPWRLIAVCAIVVLLVGTVGLLVVGLSGGGSSSAAPRTSAAAAVAKAPTYTYERHPSWNPAKPVVMYEGILQMEMTPPAPRGPTWAELSKVYRVLQPVATYMTRYDDVGAARAAGYRRNFALKAPVNYTLRKGKRVVAVRDFTHFPNFKIKVTPTINLLKPHTLVYRINRNATTGPKFSFGGVMYVVPGETSITKLESLFPPSMAMWHKHVNVCVDIDGNVIAPHDKATCFKKGGAQFVPTTTWMVHAWVGLPYGKGLFDLIPGSDPTTAATGLEQENSMPTSPTGSRIAVVTIDGPREVERLPLTGRPPTWPEVTRVYTTLSGVQRAVTSYGDPAAARRAGYVPAPALYAAGPGTHYLNQTYLAAAQEGHFTTTRPPVLVYTTVHGRQVLAGVTYILPPRYTAQQLAAIFPASLASWERMLNSCIAGNAVLPVYDAASCAAQHGLFTPRTGWMIHAWIGQAGDTALFDMDLQQ